MTRLLTAFALCALVAPVAVHAEDTDTITRTAAMPANGTLDLKTFSGHVVIAATDGQQVTITAVRHGSRQQLDRVRLDVTTSGSTVYVDANHHDHSWWHDNVVDNDLEVRVPRRTNLRITSFSAPVEIDGVDAAEVHAQTFSGRVEIRVAKWDARQRIDVKTFSGTVALRVPDNARAHVDFDSFSGRLDAELPLTLHSTSRRNLSAELGSGGSEAELRIRTFSGGVKIQR